MALFTKQHDNEDYIVLGMYLMISSDADIDEREEKGIKIILESLPRFSDIDLDESLANSKLYILENGFKNCFEIFRKVENEDLKKTILILAIEASMLDHIITDAEEDIIVELSHSMGVSDDVLETAIDVISWKYSLEEH
jgi:hypothetical protein